MSEIYRSESLRTRQVLSTGILTGGILSINADNTKFDLSAGSGLVVDNFTDTENPVVTYVSWNAFTAQTVTNIATNPLSNIKINSSGAIVQQTTSFSVDDARDFILIGRLVHNNNTNLTDTIPLVNAIYNATLDADDLARSIGSFNINGNVFSANGTNLKIKKTSGKTFRLGVNYEVDRGQPNVFTDSLYTPATFAYRYQNGSGGYTQTSNMTDIDVDSYDDGDGTLGTVTAGQFTAQRIYFFTGSSQSSPDVIIQYGQTIYNSIADAESGISTDTFNVDTNLSDALLRGVLIVKGNTTDLSDTSFAKFVPVSKFGEVGSGSSGGGGSGDVNGPSSSNDGSVVIFDGTGGKTIKDSLDYLQSQFYRSLGS